MVLFSLNIKTPIIFKKSRFQIDPIKYVGFIPNFEDQIIKIGKANKINNEEIK